MKFSLLALAITATHLLQGQEAATLVKNVKAKLSSVNDYEATGIMKTDVVFMKVPESEVKIYFKKPDLFRIRKNDGIAITPKGGITFSLPSLLAGDNFTIVAAGTTKIDNLPVTIVKLLPLDEKSNVVVSTLYIDEKESLIRKATVTTQSDGTFEVQMIYGKYSYCGLPDKVFLTFSMKDYKLPKGLAFDYDDGKNTKSTPAQDQKGKVELSYTAYTINKGVDPSIFR